MCGREAVFINLVVFQDARWWIKHPLCASHLRETSFRLLSSLLNSIEYCDDRLRHMRKWKVRFHFPGLWMGMGLQENCDSCNIRLLSLRLDLLIHLVSSSQAKMWIFIALSILCITVAPLPLCPIRFHPTPAWAIQTQYKPPSKSGCTLTSVLHGKQTCSLV